METSLEVVDFLGGPLDGYERTMTPEMLARLVEFDVSENTFRIMLRQRQKPHARTTSTAVYQLSWVEGSPRYHFLAAMPPHTSEAERRPGMLGGIRRALRKFIGGATQHGA